MSDCIFCRIARGEFNTEFVYEDADLVVFKDIRPKARVHLLVVPKLHIESLAHLEDAHLQLMGKLTVMLPKIAADNGLSGGFRTIVNTGAGGGQEVMHIHYHLLGGGPLPHF